MGAPKQVDTSKKQAQVEKAKLELQKSSDAFTEELSKKQYDIRSKAYDLNDRVRKEQNELNLLSVDNLKNTTGIISGYTKDIGKINHSRDEALDTLFSQKSSVLSLPETSRANFSTLEKFFNGEF